MPNSSRQSNIKPFGNTSFILVGVIIFFFGNNIDCHTIIQYKIKNKANYLQKIELFTDLIFCMAEC